MDVGVDRDWVLRLGKHQRQQVLARVHPLRAVGERGEQGALAFGQRYWGVADAGHLARVEIEVSAPDGQHPGLVEVAPLQGTQPGQQLLDVERLRQVVVGARVERLDPLGGVALCRQERVSP